MIDVHQIAPGVHRIEKVDGNGFSLSMFLFTLRDGGVLVHSPTWCGDGTFEAVESVGPVRAILAPNHFHHLSVPRFRQRYPEALAVCAPRARARLEKKGHAGLGELDALTPLLPSGARTIACDMKNGEAWIVWPSPEGPALVVCDAYFHYTRPFTGFKGWVLRRLHIGPGLKFGRTTKWVGVDDKATFTTWADTTVREVAPVALWPSHGDVLRAPDLPAQLDAAVRARLRP
jgi:hypothetical protein